MSAWIAYCAEFDRELVARLVASLGGEAPAFVGTADELRRVLRDSMPGTMGVVVGQVSGGVLDVNLAAAVVSDGFAREVVLALRDVPGSVLARASQAGIHKVVDLVEFEAWPTMRLDPLRPSKSAPLVCFCSGRGGEGKTSLVAVAAASASLWGMNVCAIDLDLCCGNLFSCFGLAHGTDLARLAALPEDASDALELMQSSMQQVVSGLSIAGPCARPEEAELAMPCVPALIACAKENFDLVLVDSSTTFTDAVAAAVQASDRIVLVSDGRPGSLSALARMRGLAMRLGVASTQVVQLFNRADPRSKGSAPSTYDDSGFEAVQTLQVFEGELEVGDYLGAGQAFELAESGSPFSESCATALARVLQELGRLPEREAAERAAAASGRRRRRSLFRRKAEVR